MNYVQYSKIYHRDNHQRKDALPTPQMAKKIANELYRRHTPGHAIIRNQLLLAQMFGISLASLNRLQRLVTNDRLHKYMTLTGQHEIK